MGLSNAIVAERSAGGGYDLHLQTMAMKLLAARNYHSGYTSQIQTRIQYGKDWTETIQADA
jgi:hypothetical protein